MFLLGFPALGQGQTSKTGQSTKSLSETTLQPSPPTPSPLSHFTDAAALTSALRSAHDEDFYLNAHVLSGAKRYAERNA